MLDLLVTVAHGLVVGVLDATLDIAEEKSFSPFEEPLTGWVLRFVYRHLLNYLRSWFFLSLRLGSVISLRCLRLHRCSDLLRLLFFFLLLFPIVIGAATFVLLYRIVGVLTLIGSSRCNLRLFICDNHGMFFYFFITNR